MYFICKFGWCVGWKSHIALSLHDRHTNVEQKKKRNVRKIGECVPASVLRIYLCLGVGGQLCWCIFKTRKTQIFLKNRNRENKQNLTTFTCASHRLAGNGDQDRLGSGAHGARFISFSAHYIILPNARMILKWILSL